MKNNYNFDIMSEHICQHSDSVWEGYELAQCVSSVIVKRPCLSLKFPYGHRTPYWWTYPDLTHLY